MRRSVTYPLAALLTLALGVLTFGSPAQAAVQPGCTLTVHTPVLVGTDLLGEATITCNQSMVVTAEGMLWRNNVGSYSKFGVYTSHTSQDPQQEVVYGWNTTCTSGGASRQWHLEVIETWTYDNIKGGSTKNSSDVNFGCK